MASDRRPDDHPAAARVGVVPGGEQLRRITEQLVARSGTVDHRDPRGSWQASTALVLAPGVDDVEVAIIERTRRDADRWSGQLALPGGRRDVGDRDLAATATREAAEEVGLALGAPVARVTEQRARVRPGVVACYAYALAERPRLVPDPREVAHAWWVPLRHLTDPGNATTVRHRGLRFPAIDVRGRALWGLTLLLLERFAALVDIELATG